jgi:hypothetical protein
VGPEGGFLRGGWAAGGEREDHQEEKTDVIVVKKEG